MEQDRGQADGAPEEAPSQEVRYEAFISYSRTVNDARVAREIQRFIEGFSVPRELRQSVGRARLGNVFRDEDELSAGAALSAALERALAHSPWLIVVCSPAAAASPWVAHEIEVFASRHGADHVLAVLSSGEPEEAFPAALAADTGVPGSSSEPVAADLRASVPRARRRAELLRLAAPLIGCSYDELTRRQRARHRRRVAAVAAALCACLALVGAVVALQQGKVVQAEDAVAASRARRDALAAYDGGDRIEALRLALDGVVPGGDAVQNAQARFTLAKALGVYHGMIDTMPLYAVHGVADASTLTVFPGDEPWFSLVDSPNRITVYDMETGAVACEFESSDIGAGGHAFSSYTEAAAGYLLAAFEDAGLVCYDVAGGALAWEQLEIGAVLGIELLDSERVAVLTQQGDTLELCVLTVASGEVTTSVELGEADGMSVALAAEGDRAAVACGATLFMIDIEGGTVRRFSLAAPDVTRMTLDGDALYAVSSAVSGEQGVDDTWDGHAAICAYAWEDGALRWNFERSWEATPLEFSALPFNCDATIYDVEECATLGCKVLPVVAGSSALLVDPATGDILSEITADAPIVQFSYVDSSTGEVLRTTSLTGARGVAPVCAGTASFQYSDLYAFPSYVWSAYEVQRPAARYAVACSAEQTETIYVYRDGLGLPQEPGVREIEIPGGANGISVSADRNRVAVVTDRDTIELLDGKTFERTATIELKAEGIELQSAMGTLVTFPGAAGDLVVVCDPGGQGVPPRAWQFDAATGKLLKSWTWPYAVDGISYDGCTFSSERNGYVTLSFPQGGYLGLLDTETLEILQEFTVGDTGVVDAVFVNSERYLFVFDDGSAELYDSATMDAVGDGFEGRSFEAACGVAQIAVAHDGSAIATVSPERGLTVIDAATGEVAWEAPCTATGKEFVGYTLDGSMVIVQDADGGLVCYGAQDGALMGQSDDVVGLAVVDASLSDDGTELYLRTSDTALTRCQVFDLHEGSLTLVATMEDAWSISADGTSVLARADALYRQPVYTLDELEKMARETITAYEGQ